ncbi:hypothetical protein GQ44DRAFT_718374 [Phaeosphaeriaceae sp. PMI808]|nr:hypothetical protein GQ44DRAFT_718374 [Phaeosphaeriaceae sp. PMI808]
MSQCRQCWILRFLSCTTLSFHLSICHPFHIAFRARVNILNLAANTCRTEKYHLVP